MKKIFWYDLETTGLNPKTSGIHQISGAIEIDGEVKEKFNFKVKIFETDEIHDAALKVAGITRENLLNYAETSTVFKQIISMLNKYCDKYKREDKFYLGGYNIAAFDNQFFREWFSKNGEKWFDSYFFSNPLDVFILASPELMGERGKMVNFKLSTAAEAVGVQVDKTRLHDAEYDIELTRAIYAVCSKHYKNDFAPNNL